MIADHDEDGVLVESRFLEYVDDLAHEPSLVVDAVGVVVEQRGVGDINSLIAVKCAVVVAGRSLLFQPSALGAEHDVMLVARIVGPVEAAGLHPVDGQEVSKPEIARRLASPLVFLSGGMEE